MFLTLSLTLEASHRLRERFLEFAEQRHKVRGWLNFRNLYTNEQEPVRRFYNTAMVER